MRFENNSDTEITQITVAPGAGSYTNYKKWTGTSFPTIAAAALAPALNVSILAHSYQGIRFKTCTATSPPADPDYQFDAAAVHVTYTWVTGIPGTAG